MIRHAALVSVVLLAGVAACSSDGSIATDETGPTASTIPGTIPDTTIDPGATPSVTFLSDPVDAGPLLGSGARESASAAEPCVSEDEDPCPDGPHEDLLPPDDPFVPAAEDAAFCSVLADLDERPFPSDETEAVIVAQAWFAELAPTVPPAISADFAVLSDWLDAAAASQGQISFADELSAEVQGASDRLGEYVDTNCSGYDSDPDVPTTDVPGTLAPTTSIALESPFVDPDSEPSGPLFGADARDEFFESGLVNVNKHRRSAADAAFCTLLDEMAMRPFPSDDLDQILIARVWLRELIPVAPTELTDDLTSVISWVDEIAATQTSATEPSDFGAVDLALTALDEYVDGNCYGY